MSVYEYYTGTNFSTIFKDFQRDILVNPTISTARGAKEIVIASMGVNSYGTNVDGFVDAKQIPPVAKEGATEAAYAAVGVYGHEGTHVSFY